MIRAKILSASAGSGKTYQLAYKYVRDVVERPELYRSILAVTFTNKATEEMKSRILREINTLASGQKSKYLKDLRDELSLNESTIRSRAMQVRTLILHDYSRFSVLTIDRFFQRIIRAFIKELGFDLNYNIELDPDTLLTQSVDALVERIAKNEELRRWMLAFAEERINDGDRWDVRGDLRELGGELFKERTRQCMKMKQSKEELLVIVNGYQQHAEELKATLKSYGEEAVAIMQRYGVSPEQFKGLSRSFVFAFERYAAGELKSPTATMLKAVDDIKHWYGTDASAAVRSAAGELQPILAKIVPHSNRCIRAVNTALLLKESYRSFALLSDLYNEVQEVCTKENIMILGETKHILSTFINDSNAPFIYEKVGNRYEHYMIDEFQDTSIQEWKNMLPLLQNAMSSSEDVSVLIVGDVKQSIYRWRGGDWRLLKELAAKDLGEENVLVKPMEFNYRSLDKVVKFNNEFIRSVVVKDNNYLNKLLDNALANNDIPQSLHSSLYNIVNTAYSDLKQETGLESDEEGYVEVSLYDSNIATSPFIQIIEDAISRGYRYRDILILVRSATDGRKVADELFRYKEQLIATSHGSAFNILTPDALTIDSCDISEFIIAVLRLAVNPKNDIERGVYNRYLGKGFDHQFDGDEHALLRRIAHLSPMEALELIIAEYDLNQRTDRIAYLQAMHDQIVNFTSSHIADIQHYLAWWDEHGHSETLRVEMSDNTIEITTIHKAKGLEREVVIIPYCSWSTAPRGNIRQTVWATAEQSAEATGPIGEFPVVYGSAMQQSAFTADYYRELVMSHIDAINLLYVAVTRASNELYMCVPKNLNTKSKGDITYNNIVNLASASVAEVCTDHDTVSSLEGVERITYRYGRKIERYCPEEDDKHANDIILADYITHRPELKIRYPSRRYSEEGLRPGSSQRDYGIRLHSLFERATTEAELRQAIDRMERECLIDSDDALKLHSTINEALKHDKVKEWFSDIWSDVKREAEIVAGDELRRPDRVMIEGNRAVVVDYKFGQNRDKRHLKQVADYVGVLRKMGKYDQIEGYVWYIALGEVVEI